MIAKKVISLLSEHLGIKEETIRVDDNIITDLNADSLDIVQMLITLENEFNISFDEDEVGSLKTVRDIIKFIENKTK